MYKTQSVKGQFHGQSLKAALHRHSKLLTSGIPQAVSQSHYYLHKPVLIIFALTPDITISGDGTTLRNLNYESKHANFRTTLYDKDTPQVQPDAARALDIIQGHNDAFKGVRVTRFLGLTSATDHTAETQLEGWKEMNAESHKMYNDSPQGQQAPVNPRTMPSKLTAANTDHAADQKKLARGTSDWKIESERIVRGEQEVKT